MTPQDFIRKNLMAELDKLKVPFSQQQPLADEGVRYWLAQSKFRKSAWQDTLSYVKRKAR